METETFGSEHWFCLVHECCGETGLHENKIVKELSLLRLNRINPAVCSEYQKRDLTSLTVHKASRSQAGP